MGRTTPAAERTFTEEQHHTPPLPTLHHTPNVARSACTLPGWVWRQRPSTLAAQRSLPPAPAFPPPCALLQVAGLAFYTAFCHCLPSPPQRHHHQHSVLTATHGGFGRYTPFANNGRCVGGGRRITKQAGHDVMRDAQMTQAVGGDLPSGVQYRTTVPHCVHGPARHASGVDSQHALTVLSNAKNHAYLARSTQRIPWRWLCRRGDRMKLKRYSYRLYPAIDASPRTSPRLTLPACYILLLRCMSSSFQHAAYAVRHISSSATFAHLRWRVSLT